MIDFLIYLVDEHTTPFLLTVIGILTFAEFPEVFKRGDFSKLKNFFY